MAAGATHASMQCDCSPMPLARTAAPLSILVAAGAWLATAEGSVADRLAGILESTFERPSLGDARNLAGVIALGGGELRIREAGRLARQYPHLRVVVSGSGRETYVRRLLGPGIEPERVMVENRARNTHENAVFSVAMLGSQPTERWLLVTSAAHMPRAVGAFRKRALKVEPWPVYDRLPGDASAFAVARHEWLGLLAYRLLGRTGELLPAPIATAAAPTEVAAATVESRRGSSARVPVRVSFD